MNTCSGCGIPQAFVQINRWLSNGDIVQATNQQARMAFVESENLDPVFRDIGRAIGMPIDHLVINIVARGTQLYMDSLIPEAVKELIRSRAMDIESFSRGIMDLCHAIGYGKYEFLGYRYENDPQDYCRIRITRPFSILETSGAFAGVIASSVGGEHSVTFEETAPGVYELTTGWTTYPEVLKERLTLQLYQPRPGDIELERCEKCGVPLRLARMCSWDLENGVILNRATGLRMTVVGPGLMDTVFEALEWELGEEVPRLVVDAQRRHTREGFLPIDLTMRPEEVREEFALRGLGNLQEIRMEETGASLRLDNSCMNLIIVGILQGAFERTYGKDSTADWRLEGDTLRAEVRPA